MFGFIRDMLSENSSVSSMRVMAFFSLIIGGAIAILGVYKDKDLLQVSALTTVFVGSAFGGKALQKKYEGDKEDIAAAPIQKEPK